MADVQRKLEQQNPEKFEFESQEDKLAKKMKFKASTLTHIAELRKVGQEKLESQFIERQFLLQNDIHFEKYGFVKQKEAKKSATMQRRQRNTMAMMSSQRTRSRAPNVLQEQLRRIQAIDRTAEMEHKMVQDQLRHPEIYDIIDETELQMQQQSTGLAPVHFTKQPQSFNSNVTPETQLAGVSME